MSEKGSEWFARYWKSSVVTFISAVIIVLLANWDSITLISFRDGSILGLLFLAIRAGVKAIFEAFILSRSNQEIADY